MTSPRRRLVPALVLAFGLFAATAAPAGAQSKPVLLRLGYFANVTHATPIVGVEKGFFKQALGKNRLAVRTFNAGPEAVEAVLSGALDASYIGPSPAINAYVRTKAVKIISGAASGGALLVVAPGIDGVADLKGKKVATPQLGGTQDVAARYYFKQQGYRTDTRGGGDVSIIPQANAQTLAAFRTRSIQGAWLPEPWATRAVQEAGARILLDERKIWPKGKFVTTHLIVSSKFLKEHPDVVEQLLQGQIRTNAYLQSNPAESKVAVDKGIEKITGQGISAKLLDASWKNIDFTNDPIASTLQPNADHAVEVGLLEKPNLKGIYQLGPLNKLLKAAKQPTVSDGGLG